MPCPACLRHESTTFLEIPSAPVLCNVLSATREQALALPRGPIELALCRPCGLIYNTAFEPSLLEYAATYENALHFSPAFRAYTDELAADLSSRYELRHKRIAEIGAGDGHFLAALCSRSGASGTGYDPAHARERSAIPEGVNATVLAEPFSPEHARGCDFVACRHVLEHIAEPRAFVAALREALPRSATVFFEVPDADYMLTEGAVWDVLYEHRSYFAAAPLAWLLESAGFTVLRTRSTYHGQFLTAEATAAPGPPLSDLPEPPTATAAHRFAEYYRAKVALWSRRLSRLVDANLALWGAGTKGVSFLNALGPAAERIRVVVDVNPRKWGSFTAGTGHEIVPPDRLPQLGDGGIDVVILANPVYRAEVGDQLEALGLHPELAVL